MSEANEGHELFEHAEARHDGAVVINARCRIERQGGYHVVTVAGLTLAHFGCADRMGQAYSMVTLVEQGLASQVEVALAFGCSERTVRRNQRRFESGGLSALGRPVGYPKGAARLGATRVSMVNEWKAEGVSNREIACRLGVTEKAVRKLVRRLGWRASAHQLSLGLEPVLGADPNLSGSEIPVGAVQADDAQVPGQGAATDADPNLSGSEVPVGAGRADDAQLRGQGAATGADPNLSGSEVPVGAVQADDAQVPGQGAATGADPNLSGSEVQQLDGPEVVKLRVERKHLTDLLNMVAYQAECELVRLISPHFSRAEQEAPTLVQSALACTGDISLADGELHIALEPLSSPHRTAALASLCEHINESTTRFPGSDLRLRFSIKPQPAISPAFPGAKTSHPSLPQPDIREPG